MMVMIADCGQNNGDDCCYVAAGGMEVEVDTLSDSAEAEADTVN
jgi:hypothetical protein